MSSSNKYRSRSNANRVIGLSVSYQRENLLARGLGLEHLREMLVLLARPLLRQGAGLAYGGHWKETDDNLTFDLLRLINAEQEDNSLGGPDTHLQIGRLYNHCAWPAYLQVTPRIEAQWLHCCRIVRIAQTHAGIPAADLVPDAQAEQGTDRSTFNAAVTLSAMRRLAADGVAVEIPELASPETIPPVIARVALGGKVDDFSGFLPGIFEEALVTLEREAPLYILGGFGGAAEVLACALLGPPGTRPNEFAVQWHIDRNAKLAKLAGVSGILSLPPGVRSTGDALDALFARVEKARKNLAGELNTGLDEAQTRELLLTRDMRRAVGLVLKGLNKRFGLVALPS